MKAFGTLASSQAKLGLGILATLLMTMVALSGCETIDGTLRTAGLVVTDKSGDPQTIPGGSVRLVLRGQTLVFKDMQDHDKVKISVPSGTRVPNIGETLTIGTDQTGQNFDIIASATLTGGGGNSSVHTESCDCDGPVCYGERQVTVTSSTSTTSYLFRFVQTDTGADLGDFNAAESSSGSYSDAGPCIDVRPRPFCPPGTIYDRSIGRCVSIVVNPPQPPRPNCPPGTVFDPSIDRCVSVNTPPSHPQPPRPHPQPDPRPIPNPDGATNCPPGTHYDPSIARCVA